MGQPSFNDDERRLFALLPCWMDLVLLIPKNILFISSLHRLQFTSPLVHLILLQSSIYTTKAMFELFEAKHHVVSDHCQVIVNLQESLLPSLSSSQQRSVSFSVELGSSLSEHGFILHKELLGMLCVLGMAGDHLCYHLIVFAMSLLQLNML